jgi:hypothetical protein
MSAFPGGGAAVANPPLYPDYVSQAVFVVGGNSASFSPFSGPKGSPFDALMYPANIANPIPSQRVANTLDHSTGALSTGIGFESTDNGQLVAGITTGNLINTGSSGAAKGIPTNGPGALNGFTDDYQPGISLPSGVSATTAILLAIGGGKSTANGTTVAQPPTVAAPYSVQPILDMGVGGSRDAGAGPAFTGFGMKSVTATADVAQGGVIETGFVNRTAPAASGIVLKNGASAFGSSTTASPAVT